MEAITALHQQLQQTNNELENIENLILNKENDILILKELVFKQEEQFKSLNTDIQSISNEFQLCSNELESLKCRINSLENEKFILNIRINSYNKLIYSTYWKYQKESYDSVIKFNVVKKDFDDYRIKLNNDYYVQECTLEMQISEVNDEIDSLKSYFLNNALTNHTNDNQQSVITNLQTNSEAIIISSSASAYNLYTKPNLKDLVQTQRHNTMEIKEDTNELYYTNNTMESNPWHRNNRKRNYSQIMTKTIDNSIVYDDIEID